MQDHASFVTNEHAQTPARVLLLVSYCERPENFGVYKAKGTRSVGVGVGVGVLWLGVGVRARVLGQEGGGMKRCDIAFASDETNLSSNFYIYFDINTFSTYK